MRQSPPVGGVLTAPIGTMAAGATSTFRVVVRPAAAGPLSLTPRAASGLSDPIPANNAAEAVTVVNTSIPVSASQLILYQDDERPTYLVLARALRAQVRGVRGREGELLRMSVNSYLRDLLRDLRDHWLRERRSTSVMPFDFPDL